MIRQELPSQNLEQDSSSLSSDFQIQPSYEQGLDQPYSYIGILIVEKQNTSQISFSTAFLLTEFCIIASSHSFENKSEQFIANKIVFIPGCNKKLGSLVYHQKLVLEQNVYSTHRHPVYCKKRVSRELTMIFVKNPIRVGISIPAIINWKREKYLQKNVSIVGYRKIQLKYFPSPIRLQEIQIERVQINENVYTINKENHEIKHFFQTTKGMSGSPIFGYLKKNGKTRQVIMGVHTHKSNLEGNPNLGLLFTDQIQKIIQEYLQKHEQTREIQSSDQSL